MNKTFVLLGALITVSAVSACGGGSTTPNINPTPTPIVTPIPGASPQLVGTLNLVNGGANYGSATYVPAGAQAVDFTCGCTSVAGSGTTDGSGNFSLVAVSTPVPQPNPMYTIVPGRNYLVVANPASGPQAWTMVFAGKQSSHNQYLNPGSQLASAPSDVYSAAVALYVYQYSTPGSVAYDDWNFNTLVNWYNTLKTAPTAAEANLLTTIFNESVAGHSLWPATPGWRSVTTNANIKAALTTVNHNVPPDATLPTRCPGNACTSTPTP